MHGNWNDVGLTLRKTEVYYKYLNKDAIKILKCTSMEDLIQDRNDAVIILGMQGNIFVLTDASAIRRGADSLGNMILAGDMGLMMQHVNLCNSNLKNIFKIKHGARNAFGLTIGKADGLVLPWNNNTIKKPGRLK
jgi:hypothetical protein